jgi:hypothetical protein
VLTERAAGAALSTLRYAKRLPHAVDALPAARRAQKFPRGAFCATAARRNAVVVAR